MGPIGLAKVLGVDKATASRLLRAVGSGDSLGVLQTIPGPEPLREVAEAAGRRGAGKGEVGEFLEAVGMFESVILSEAGDRSGLDAMLTAWLPEAREEFELKRKQAVFRNISQLKGKVAEVSLAAAMIYPSPNGEHLDVVWVLGYLKLQRLRPGVMLNFASRRVSTPHGEGTTREPRRPRTLEGVEVEGLSGLLLPECCSTPLPEVRVEKAGDLVHYILEGDSFGPRSCRDVVFAEVNRAELPRYVSLEPRRKRFVYIDVPIPSELLLFDIYIHEAVLGDSDPGLMMFDTANRGVADVNDPARRIDRIEMVESLKSLGRGTVQSRVSEAPWYRELLGRVCKTMGWEEGKMRGYRARMDYPLYGTQVAITYDAQGRPG